MTQALRDDNRNPTVLWVSSVDWVTPTRLKINPVTWRVIASLTWAWAWDVVWPASATNNAVVRWDTTTWALVQDSNVIIADTTWNISWVDQLTLWVASASAWVIVAQNATNANTVTIQSWVTSGSYTLTLPLAVAWAWEVLTDAAWDWVLSWGSWAAWASKALDDLASVAINTTLVSDTDNTDDLGTAAIWWKDLYMWNTSVITWSTAPSTADVTLTHSANALTFAGWTIALWTATATWGLTWDLTGQADTVATITWLAPDTATTQATQASITTCANLVTVWALDAWSITSGFTSIDVGAWAIDWWVITADTNFAWALTGNVTWNCSWSAWTVATITGLAPDTATTQATQASITTCANLTTAWDLTTWSIWTWFVVKWTTMTLWSDATWDIYYRSAWWVLTRLAASTDWHVLTTGWAWTAPAWEAAAWGWGWLDLYFWWQEWELAVASVSRRFVSWTATASSFKCTLEVAWTGSTQVVTLYKNWVSEAVCTFTDGQAAAANWLVVQDDATLTSWSYAENDLLEVKVTSIWSTTPWIWLQWAIIV